MLAYRKRVKLKKSGCLSLTGLPFSLGQRVEVLVLAANDTEKKLAAWNKLFKQTQNLPQAQDISEQEIAEEIAEYRNSR